MGISTREQLDTFKMFLADKKLNKTHPVFESVIKWVRQFPGGFDEREKTDLRSIICTTFGITREELVEELSGSTLDVETVTTASARALEQELRDLVPKGGFFDKYLTYTERSEAPLAYHLFCALVGVGVTVNRRVFFDMGYYRVYPNIGVILIGPSGIKKTSAANIIIGMLSKLELSKIYSEKLTPEQLVEAMKDHAQGLIYAPEMAVFLGRQRYMEGIIPLITRFMDCPDVWSSETVGRGKSTLTDLAISSLMCSTADWFINNTTEDVVGGGFIARNIIVVQNDSPRTEPIPRPGDPSLKETLTYAIGQIHDIKGEIFFSQGALDAYKSWYVKHKQDSKHVEHEILATYYQRKPDHAKRVAICLHLAEHGTSTLCIDCFTRAVQILDWVEQFLPGLIKEMFKSTSGHNAQLVVATIRTGGGVIEHSDLLRRLQHRLNGTELKNVLNALKDSGVIEETNDKLQHCWYIKRRTE